MKIEKKRVTKYYHGKHLKITSVRFPNCKYSVLDKRSAWVNAHLAPHQKARIGREYFTVLLA